MVEVFRSFNQAIKTTGLLVHDVLRHSTSTIPSVSYWDDTDEQQFEKLVCGKLSNPNDEERVKIRGILKRFKVESVLDLGSGPSTEFAGFALDEDLADISYIGLDGSQKMLQTARERYPEVTLVRGSIEQAPFKDKSFDAVVVKHILEHQPNGYKDTLYEAVRLARKCVLIDFFHVPMRFGIPDLKIKDYKGYANNWFSKSKFEDFLRSLLLTSWERTSCEGRRGQFGAIYTLVI